MITISVLDDEEDDSLVIAPAPDTSDDKDLTFEQLEQLKQDWLRYQQTRLQIVPVEIESI
jgi:hypothetical protein